MEGQRFLLEMLIERAKKLGQEAVQFFDQKSADGQVMTPRKRFAENLFACAYTQTPEGYLKFNEVKIGDETPAQSHERTFFETLLKSTIFSETRAATVRNVAVAVNTCIGMMEEAWAAYNNYRRNEETGYLAEDGEPTPLDSMAGSIRAMATKAKDEAEGMAQAIALMEGKGYGIFPSESEGKLPSKETADALALLRKAPYLKGIIEMLGRVNRVRERAITDSIRSGTIIPHKIELGRDIPQILPAEMGIGRRLRTMFLAQLAEGSLLMDGLGQPEHKAEGGIIVICDETSSMNHQNRIVWAKAIAACMYLATKVDGRPFHYFPFGMSLGKPRCDLPGILETSFNYGGTDIPAVLDDFRSKASKDSFAEKIGIKSADVVVITDGDSPSQRGDSAEKFQKFRESKGFRLLSIVISDDGQRSQSVGVVAPYSNKVISTGSDPSSNMLDTKSVFDWTEGDRDV